MSVPGVLAWLCRGEGRKRKRTGLCICRLFRFSSAFEILTIVVLLRSFSKDRRNINELFANLWGDSEVVRLNDDVDDVELGNRHAEMCYLATPRNSSGTTCQIRAWIWGRHILRR